MISGLAGRDIKRPCRIGVFSGIHARGTVHISQARRWTSEEGVAVDLPCNPAFMSHKVALSRSSFPDMAFPLTSNVS